MEEKRIINYSVDTYEPIREVLGNPPKWIVRWGNSVILIFFLSLLLLSAIIKYPEVVRTNATLTCINAPKSIISRGNGKLIKLLVSESQKVKKGEIIGFMESTSDHGEIFQIEMMLDSIQLLLTNNNPEFLQKIMNKRFVKLGDLQEPYQNYLYSYFEYKSFLTNGFFVRRLEILKNDLFNLKRAANAFLEQKGLLEQDLELSEKTFSSSKKLVNEKVLSQLDYRNEESKLIGKKLTIPQVKSAIINNESLQNEKQKEISEIEDKISRQQIFFQQQTNTLRSQIDIWKKKYLLISPIDGIISFAMFIQENQEIRDGETICFVNPSNTMYEAQMIIPQYNFGKVLTGQKVILKFPSYPYQEYGFLQGEIQFINHIQMDSGYLAKVALNQKLTTSYKKNIQYRDGLTAQAEIITKEMTLFQRFYQRIVSVTNDR